MLRLKRLKKANRRWDGSRIAPHLPEVLFDRGVLRGSSALPKPPRLAALLLRVEPMVVIYHFGWSRLPLIIFLAATAPGREAQLRPQVVFAGYWIIACEAVNDETIRRTCYEFNA